MRASRSTTGISIGLLVLFFGACGGGAGGGGGDDGGGPDPTQLFVDGAAGDDANDGLSGNPMRTVTRALANAVDGDVIHVAPGEYDEGNGEVFPLIVPPGVTLIGDEAAKGRGRTPTLLVGAGPWGNAHAVIVAQQDAVVAGFWLYGDPLVTLAAQPHGIVVQASQLPSLKPGATIRNNTVEGPYPLVTGERAGILIVASTSVHRIEGNVVRLYPAGIAFQGGIAEGGARIEANLITNNVYGVAMSGGNGADLGGGEYGSGGLNEFGCNSLADAFAQNPVNEIPAQNNRWDHQVGDQFGIVVIPAGTMIDRTGGALNLQICTL